MDKKKISRILIHNIERRFDLMYTHKDSIGKHYFNYYGKQAIRPIIENVHEFLIQYFPTYGRFDFNIVRVEQEENWILG
jgi:hypothetical protein